MQTAECSMKFGEHLLPVGIRQGVDGDNAPEGDVNYQVLKALRADRNEVLNHEAILFWLKGGYRDKFQKCFWIIN